MGCDSLVAPVAERAGRPIEQLRELRLPNWRVGGQRLEVRSSRRRSAARRRSRSRVSPRPKPREEYTVLGIRKEHGNKIDDEWTASSPPCIEDTNGPNSRTPWARMRSWWSCFETSRLPTGWWAGRPNYWPPARQRSWRACCSMRKRLFDPPFKRASRPFSATTTMSSEPPSGSPRPWRRLTTTIARATTSAASSRNSKRMCWPRRTLAETCSSAGRA